jgi:hypothetical protein
VKKVDLNDLCITLRRSPSGTLQIRVFSSLTVYFKLTHERAQVQPGLFGFALPAQDHEVAARIDMALLPTTAE